MENTLVHNNLIHDCSGPVIQPDGENSVCEESCPDQPAAMAGTKIINNTIYSTATDSGIVNLFGENNRDNLGKYEFRNNIVICADSYCIQEEQSHDDDFMIDHNVYYASKPDTWVFYNGNEGWSTMTEWQNNSPYDDHSLLIPPKLTQQPPTAVTHFKLQSDSPCIGQGIQATLFNDGYFGTSRQQGTGWDSGAHEFSD